MKTYTCTCGQLTFFENVTCVACGRELGFLPDELRLTSLEPAENGLFKGSEREAQSCFYMKGQNYARESVCNWMIPAGSSPAQIEETFCVSCRLNQTIPDLSIQR